MKPHLSLEAILLRLVGRGVQLAASTAPRTDKGTPTSLRLKPQTRHFLEVQATALNTSLQGLIDAILDGVMEATNSDPAATLRSIHERFFLLLEAHGLDLPSAADLLHAHGFTLSSLGNKDRLLDLLTTDAIDELARFFHVRPEWLSGASDKAVNTDGEVRWYKAVGDAANVLVDRQKNDHQPSLMVIRRRRADFEKASLDNDRGSAQTEPVGIVLRQLRKTPAGTFFTTYQLWQFERWNYEPCRRDLKLLFAFCEQMRISVVGHELESDSLNQLLSGSHLPSVLLDRLGAVSWHPDDYASFAFRVQRESDEWERVALSYRNSELPRIAEKAGAAELAIEPWRPK